MNTCELTPALHDEAMALAGKLGQWFSDDGLTHMAVDMHHQPGIAATRDGALVGFLTWYVTEGSVCIGWIAVESQSHRQGVGAALVDALKQTARSLGLNRMRVWTLSQSVDYPPYERTRAFYRAMGFVSWKRIPGYCDDGSEMEIYQLELDP